jgi:exodeoxyribonuclease X
MTERQLVRTLDLETTDFPPEADVIEAGYVDSMIECDEPLEGADKQWRISGPIIQRAQQSFFKPDRECTIKAKATHHIDESEYRHAPHHTEAPHFILHDDPKILVAHNADFEKQFIQVPEGTFWVDTYKVALRLYPDFEGHSNQFLRYALGIELGSEAMPPHRALPDSYVTAHVFATMLGGNGATLKQMIKWSAAPPYLTKIGFGKHFGVRFDEAPKSYLNWILSQQDFDPAVVAACRRVLYGEE